MSLFNRPTWAKSQTSELNESESNIFSHSDRSYREIVAETERKRKDREERKKVKEERRTSEKHKLKDEPSEDGLTKRRRITLEDGEALLNSVGLSSTIARRSDDEEDYPSSGLVEEPVRRSPRINRHVNRVSPRKAKKPSRSTEVIDVGDSDSGDVELLHSTQLPGADATEEESDEEFAELARRARLQRQQKERQDRDSGTPDVTAHSPSPGVGAVDTGQRSLPTPPPDPIVQLFISSRIPNTNPLIVHRRLSQRLEEIRKAWCKKQNFSDEASNDVFFIHRMRRVYDVTTCKSLGLDVDAFGNLTMKGAEGKEGAEKVHLEAVTEDIFEQIKAEKAQESKRRSGELPPERSAAAGAADEEDVNQQSKEESLIRLTLKAKGREDFKLKVKPVSYLFHSLPAYRLPNRLVDNTIFKDRRCILQKSAWQ